MPQFAFWEHSPFTPVSNAPLDCLKGFGTPREMVSLAFALEATVDCDEVELHCSGLEAGSSVIPESAVDLHLVKRWEQAGIGIYQTDKVVVPELLVKDDREEFVDGYSRQCAFGLTNPHWRHLARPAKFYRAPQVRLTGNPQTRFQAREKKQIWVTVQIPVDAVAGYYTGYIEVTHLTSSQSERLKIELGVLPFQLSQPSQDFFLWYKGSLDCLWSQHHVSEAVMQAQLEDIYRHGFTSFSLSECKAELLQKAIYMADAIGFQRHVVLMSPWPENLEAIDFKRLTPIFYLSDEIDVRDASFTQAHQENWRAIKSWGGKTMASLTHQSAAKRVFLHDGVNTTPDVLNCYLPENRHYFAFRSQFAEVQAQVTYYYWLSHMEKPNLHRVLAGLWLWKSKADGIAPYCYQHLPGLGSSPFNDFDANANEAPDLDPANQQSFKDIMTTYPAATGSIPTLQWKGLSAGITDLKYLTTLNETIKKAQNHQTEKVQRLGHEAQQRTDAFLDRISLPNIETRSASKTEPYDSIAPHEYAAFRQQMARDIVLLQNALQSS